MYNWIHLKVLQCEIYLQRSISLTQQQKASNNRPVCSQSYHSC